jgi:hypothetical protein
MSDLTLPFSDAEVCEQAKLNARIFPLLLMAYAKQQGQQPADALRYLGGVVAPEWDELRGQGALAVARTTALNFASLGAVVERLVGDAAQAETTVTGWPTDEDLAFCGLTREEADALFASWDTIADRLGLRYAWRREEDRPTLSFTQTGATG